VLSNRYSDAWTTRGEQETETEEEESVFEKNTWLGVTGSMLLVHAGTGGRCLVECVIREVIR
jgi:hypothetical protein